MNKSRRKPIAAAAMIIIIALVSAAIFLFFMGGQPGRQTLSSNTAGTGYGLGAESMKSIAASSNANIFEDIRLNPFAEASR